MNTPTFITNYVWRSAEFPVCTVNVPVARLAERLSFPLVQWEEPGLGSATGFGCRLSSGLVLLLEEFAHAREHLGAKGPTIYVEAVELIEHGIVATLASALAGLNLSHQEVDWVQTDSGLQSARQFVQAAGDRASKHDVA
jgi:hypothetical protein